MYLIYNLIVLLEACSVGIASIAQRDAAYLSQNSQLFIQEEVYSLHLTDLKIINSKREISEAISLQLSYMQIWSPDAKIYVPLPTGTVSLPIPKARAYRGHVEGKLQSPAVLYVEEGNITGMVHLEGKPYGIHSDEEFGLIIIEGKDFTEPFECGNLSQGPTLPPPPPISLQRSVTTDRKDLSPRTTPNMGT
jgi:hypothetical protein